MIKRLWLTIKFLFTGKVDGYISYDESLRMKVSISNDFDRYATKVIAEAIDNFCKSLALTGLRDIAQMNWIEIGKMIDRLEKVEPFEGATASADFQAFYVKEMTKLTDIREKLIHDIELLVGKQ